MTASVTTMHDFGIEVVTVRGELDLSTAPKLQDALVAAIDAADAMNAADAVNATDAINATDALNAGNGEILVDLTEVSFVDSTALAAFVAARAHAKAVGATLELVCPNPNIQRVFAITALDRVFRIHDHLPGNRAPRGPGGTTEPSDGMHSVRFEASDETPAAARRFISDNLVDLNQNLMGDLLLLVSEVVTNAVRYGGSELELRVWSAGDRVRVEVQDPGLDELPDAPESVAVTTGRGRGLLIVDSLATGWGVTPAPAGAGKIVWFELARPA